MPQPNSPYLPGGKIDFSTISKKEEKSPYLPGGKIDFSTISKQSHGAGGTWTPEPKIKTVARKVGRVINKIGATEESLVGAALLNRRDAFANPVKAAETIYRSVTHPESFKRRIEAKYPAKTEYAPGETPKPRRVFVKELGKGIAEQALWFAKPSSEAQLLAGNLILKEMGRIATPLLKKSPKLWALLNKDLMAKFKTDKGKLLNETIRKGAEKFAPILAKKAEQAGLKRTPQEINDLATRVSQRFFIDKVNKAGGLNKLANHHFRQAIQTMEGTSFRSGGPSTKEIANALKGFVEDKTVQALSKQAGRALTSKQAIQYILAGGKKGAIPPKQSISVFYRTNVPISLIKKSGFKTLENTKEVFVSNMKEGQAEGYGKNVIELKIDPKDLRLDDEFPSGEKHFAIKKNIADKALQAHAKPTEAPLFKPGMGEEQKLIAWNKLIKGEGFTVAPISGKMRQFIRNLPDNISKRDAIARMKAAEKLVGKVGRKLAKPLPESKVQPVAKKTTGQVPAPKGEIKKDLYIRNIIGAQAKGAKFGLLEGRRQYAEIVKGIRIKQAEKLKKVRITAADKAAVKAWEIKEVSGIKKAATTYLKQNLEPKDRAKFIDAIRTVDSYKDLRRITDRAEMWAAKTGRRQAIDGLKKEIKQSRSALTIGRLKKGKQRVAVEAQDRLRDIIDNLTQFEPGGKKQKALDLASAFFAKHPAQAMPLELQSKISDLSKSNISEMSTEEIRQTAKDIKDIRETGRTALEAKQSRDAAKLEIEKNQLYNSINKYALSPLDTSKLGEKLTPAERQKGLGAKLKESLNRAGADLKEPVFIDLTLDGHNLIGPAFEAFQHPLNIAADKAAVQKDWVRQQVKSIRTALGKNWASYLNKVETVGGRKFSKRDMWGIYLHSKNPGNLATLTEDWGYHFPQSLVNDVITKLSPRDKILADKLQAIKQHFWPETVRVTMEYLGFRPQEVEGHWPLIGDRELSDRALMREQEKDLLADVWKRLSMDLGSVKQRVGHMGPPILDPFQVLRMHTDRVIHFNTHALPIRRIQQIINDPLIKAAISNSVGEGGYKALKSSLTAVANPRRTPEGWFEAQMGKLRANTSIVYLGYKVSVSLLQTGSIWQTVHRVGLKNTLWGLKTYWKNPRDADKFIYSVAPAMRLRKATFDRDLQFTLNHVPWLAKLAGGKELAFYLIQAMDHITTMPSWLAAFKQGAGKLDKPELRLGLETYATNIATITQPTSRTKDLAAIMRGNQFKRIFVMFYTFFTSMFNNAMEAAEKLGYRFVKSESGKAGLGEKVMASGEFARALVWVIIVPAVYAAIIRKPWKVFDKKYLLKSIPSYGLAGIPFGRDVGNVIINPQFNFTGSPVFGVGEATKNLFIRKAKTAGGKHTENIKRLKAATMITGFATGFPSRQAIITVGGAVDLMEGNTDNPLRLFLSAWTLGDQSKKKSTPKTSADFNRIVAEKIRKSQEKIKDLNRSMGVKSNRSRPSGPAGPAISKSPYLPGGKIDFSNLK